MSSRQVPEQPFEALCGIVSRERWCWKLYCTTCGHMLFRYGLRQLALGAHPGSTDWLVHSDNPTLRTGATLRELGAVPPFSGWPREEQWKLKAIVKDSDIGSIASKATFPDWLGYL